MIASAASTRLRGRLLALAVALAILAASVVRVPGDPSPAPGLLGGTDLFHLGGYAALAVAVAGALSEHRAPTKPGHSGVLAAVAVATLFGVAVELVQAPIPWRSFAVADAGINAFGAVVGVAVLRGWRRWRR